ncbi:MAG: hypothetical protein RQ723_02150 [Desulfuromonadales bacterium]|nr:hypothetical protein [Desulfuromonadales bacterium]
MCDNSSPITIGPLAPAEYRRLLDNSTILEKDARGAKVLLTPQGQIVKLFSLKRWWSSALLRPYAVRFVDNARRLRALGLRTVQVDDLRYCRDMRRYLVFYTPVPGETLRNRLAQGADCAALLTAFAGYVAQLHHMGVLFRSIHFGNLIVVDGEGGFGLIDVADMQLKKTTADDCRAGAQLPAHEPLPPGLSVAARVWR